MQEAMELVATPGQQAAYREGDPFPHIVIDGLFPAEILEDVLSEFPKPGEMNWRSYDSATEKKLGMRLGNKIGPRSQEFLYYLNSPPVLRYLEQLTGIKGLVPDPYYLGGGLHQIERGGFLKIHADFNWHEAMKLHRRINLLVYLNKDWEDSFGGKLELWKGDDKEGGPRKMIAPIFGRCVVFNTTDFSYHGHPDPLNCPEGRTRKSIALYYYSATRPASELTAEHGTLFLQRTTGEWKEAASGKMKAFLRDLIPPALLKGLRKLRGGGEKKLEDF
jgi:hypothetical protein